jgi:hypothetical protein
MQLSDKSSPLSVELPRDTQPSFQQRYQAILFWASAALAALCIDFGAFHRLHDSDSIVPVMVSLTRWTPFYWEQDRFGMLVPLLAIPFKSPLANLLAQSAFNSFCGLAAFFLCARYGVGKGWLFIGALSGSCFLLFNAPETSFQYLGLAQPYGVGMFLGLGSLLVLRDSNFSRRSRIALCLICLLLASWVDAAIVFVLLPLLVLRSWFDSRCAVVRHTFTQRAKHFLNHAGLALMLVLISFAATYVFSGLASYSARYGDWPYSPVSPWRWPAVWYQLGRSVWFEYLTGSWKVAIASLLALGFFFRLLFRGRVHRTNAPSAILLASALASFLSIGSLSHVEGTEFEPRFALQSLMLLQVAAVTWGFLPLHAVLTIRGRKILSAACLLLFLGTPLYVYGPPSLAKVRADLDETLGKHTADIIASGATHVVGNYWKVWPATFHANLVLHENGSYRRVWGVTTRSTPTQMFWSAIPVGQMRLAAIVGDPEVESMLRTYSFPPVTEERRFTDILVFKPVINSIMPR